MSKIMVPKGNLLVWLQCFGVTGLVFLHVKGIHNYNVSASLVQK